jgi:hypothetical protein
VHATLDSSVPQSVGVTQSSTLQINTAAVDFGNVAPASVSDNQPVSYNALSNDSAGGSISVSGTDFQSGGNTLPLTQPGSGFNPEQFTDDGGQNGPVTTAPTTLRSWTGVANINGTSQYTLSVPGTTPAGLYTSTLTLLLIPN